MFAGAHTVDWKVSPVCAPSTEPTAKGPIEAMRRLEQPLENQVENEVLPTRGVRYFEAPTGRTVHRQTGFGAKHRPRKKDRPANGPGGAAVQGFDCDPCAQAVGNQVHRPGTLRRNTPDEAGQRFACACSL